jgi:hypothetical protein
MRIIRLQNEAGYIWTRKYFSGDQSDAIRDSKALQLLLTEVDPSNRFTVDFFDIEEDLALHIDRLI